MGLGVLGVWELGVWEEVSVGKNSKEVQAYSQRMLRAAADGSSGSGRFIFCEGKTTGRMNFRVNSLFVHAQSCKTLCRCRLSSDSRSLYL